MGFACVNTHLLFAFTQSQIACVYCRNPAFKNINISVALKCNFVLACLQGLSQNSGKKKRSAYMNLDSLQAGQRTITFVIKPFQTNNLNNHGVFLKLDNTYIQFIFSLFKELIQFFNEKKGVW